MSPYVITHLILHYRYWVLIPLAIVGGPIVAFISGTLAAVGYFDIYVLAVIFFIRDVGLDLVFYAAGYFGGHSDFTERMLRRVGIKEKHLGLIRNLWMKRPGITMFAGKLAYGISTAFIAVAGMVKMPMRTFLIYASIVTVVEYGGLLLAGYFLGASFGGRIEHLIQNIEYGVLGAVVFFIGFYVLSSRMRDKLLEEDEEVTETAA